MEPNTEHPAGERLIIGVVAPLLTLVAIIAPILIGWGSGPEPLAVGWGDGGRADSSASQTTFLLLQSGGAVLCAALFVIGGRRVLRTPIYNGIAAVIAASLAPTLALVSLSTVLINRGQRVWTEVEDPGWWWLAAVALSPLVAIIPVGWLMRASFMSPSPPVGPAPTAGLSLAETQTAAWHSGATSSWLTYLTLAMMLLGVAATVAGGFALGFITVITGLSMVLASVLMLALSSVRVTVDRNGMTVRYGPLPWPTTRIALSAIDTVSTLEVKPMEHGGWGYRGSRKLFGKAAVVIRAGEAIRLDLADDTQFVVTVDDAELGAGVLNDLRLAAAPR